ncbi:PREDICTED: sorting nexin-8-like [Priapulus caudatus]|uniref:Sorting nexin-8-like n=1 Tax=Priapulus caudatus TaxID=37621 RepID=A0ABM1FB20_PRICU|nr:PREDICTED: sorting nexin-8-like [Priapulus caudatus]
MATELAFGSVPPFYREVYDIVCPTQESEIDRDMFIRMLLKSNLPRQTLSEIWDHIDTKHGFLTRNGLYKALALAALAQQGKTISEKLLENFSTQELPIPSLGDLNALKTLSVQVRREKNPTVLGYTYPELCELDSISVELAAEKKGLVFKHVEYEVKSEKHKTTVLRRYNDFLAFHELLLVRFPYRMVPRLPPKHFMNSDDAFLEDRRRALKRFVMLVVRHPVLCSDVLTTFFITFNGSDVQYKIKEQYRNIPDEFVTSQLAGRTKELVLGNTQMEYSNAREQIRLLRQAVCRMKDIAQRMAERSARHANDLSMFGNELSSLSSDTSAVSRWACGNIDNLTSLRRSFRHLPKEFSALTEKLNQQAIREEEGVVEKLNLFKDLLSAYKDLCERLEKGVMNDHQRAIAKLGSYKKQVMKSTIKGAEGGDMDRLESKIIEQESEISSIENRNYFSLHCVHMETQLAHANVEILSNLIHTMVSVQIRGHSELAQLWEQVRPMVENMLPLSRPGSPTSPLPSPTGDANGRMP